MTTKPIEWHEECLKNQKASIKRAEDSIARERERLNKLIGYSTIYQHQVDSAKREGKTEFDRDRYKMKELSELSKILQQ